MRRKRFRRNKEPDYEALGRMLVNVYETGYIDRNQTYKMSFVKGAISGLGGVIGATLVVALLLWLLSVFHYVPFLNKITDNVQRTIQHPQAQKK